MISISKIAALAEVSPTTVSNVLHGRTGEMKAETLERVRRVLREQNYVPNLSGRNLAKYGSKIIAVIRTAAFRDEMNIIQDPFYSEIIGALERGIRSHGYFMMLYMSENIDECLRMAKSWNAEGLISLNSNADDSRKLMENIAIPLVFTDSSFHKDGLSYVNIGLQEWRGGYLMGEYLISQGHKRIAILVNDPGRRTFVTGGRVSGCKAAMKAKGLRFLPEDYIYLKPQVKERRKTLLELIRKNKGDYTALFFGSDYYAAEAINLFRNEGIRVPQDISVTGFDDNIFAVTVWPALTTIRQDVTQKALCAVEQVFRLIRKEPLETRQIFLPVSLVIRDSVTKKQEILS
jgi:LacI family transcriptional regulator